MISRDLKRLGLIYESMYEDGNVKGLGEFLFRLSDQHPKLEPHLQIIKDTIIKSGCPEIRIMDLKHGLGASLKSYVLVSPAMINSSAESCLYGLFHEIAHQYQYKKYGDRIAQIFLNSDENIFEDAKFLEKIENTADQFGMRKCRELAQKGILNDMMIRRYGAYSSFGTQDFIKYLKQFKKVLIKKKIKDINLVDDIFYEYITGQKVQKLESI